MFIITIITINSIMKTMGRSKHQRETAHVNIAMNHKSAKWILFLMSLGKSITVYQIIHCSNGNVKLHNRGLQILIMSG